MKRVWKICKNLLGWRKCKAWRCWWWVKLCRSVLGLSRRFRFCDVETWLPGTLPGMEANYAHVESWRGWMLYSDWLGFWSKGFAVTHSVPSLYLYESAGLRCKLIIVRPNLSGKLIRCFCQTIKWKNLIREVDV